jgi:hypothetical protein
MGKNQNLSNVIRLGFIFPSCRFAGLCRVKCVFMLLICTLLRRCGVYFNNTILHYLIEIKFFYS